MAEKVTVIRKMVDDLDGTEYDPEKDEGATVAFGWRGKEYRIDLRSDNAVEFEKLMGRYVEHAMRVGNSPGAKASGHRAGGGDGRRRGGGQTMGRSKEELAEIRVWLRENGHEVADSGLIPKRLVELWEKRELIPTVPNTGTPAAARPAGKAPGKAEAPKEPAKVSPLDALIPPRVSAQVSDPFASPATGFRGQPS